MNQVRGRLRFHHVAWGLLFYNLAVIVWGAYVRASKSGDGCGTHWPSCGGELVPTTGHIPTWIEYAHRISTSVLVPIIIGLLIWASREFGPKSAHPNRHVIKGMWTVLGFTLLEGAIGAMLVKFGLVANNSSTMRAFVLSTHLASTFLLLAALAVTALWSGGVAPMRWRDLIGSGAGKLGWSLFAALAATMVLGVSGAVTALGDTLYPSTSLMHGIQQDLSPTSHLLIRLRVWHPFIAIAVSVGLLLVAAQAKRENPSPLTNRFALALPIWFAAQLAGGLLNLVMLAPIWMQLIHLLMADIGWLALVGLTASALSARSWEQEQEMPLLKREVASRWPVKYQSTL